eukprot:3522877-Lingulodinium_polyedra.AAC.1
MATGCPTYADLRSRCQVQEKLIQSLGERRKEFIIVAVGSAVIEGLPEVSGCGSLHGAAEERAAEDQRQ